MELLNKIEIVLEKISSFIIDHFIFLDSQQKDFNEIVKDVIEKDI